MTAIYAHENQTLMLQSPYLHRKTIAYALHLMELPSLRWDDDLFMLVGTLLDLEEFNALRDRFVTADTEECKCPTSDIRSMAEDLALHFCRRRNEADLKHATCALLEARVKSLSTDPAGDMFRARLHELESVFQLDSNSSEILVFLYLVRENRHFAVSVGHLYRHVNTSQRLYVLRAATGFHEMELNALLAQGKPLRRFGLVDSDLDLRPHPAEFLNGLRHESLQSQYFTQFTGEALPLAAFPHLSVQIDHVSCLIQNRTHEEGLHLLFHGVPGTGKSELARSLGLALDRQVSVLNSMAMGETSSSRDELYRYAAYGACQNSVNPATSLIIADEAEDLLSSPGSFSMLFKQRRPENKAMINGIMDQSRHVTIWIVNDISGTDESTLRRFDYAVEFRPFTSLQRQQVWRRCLAKHGIKSPGRERLLSLARRYPVNAGGIELAVRSLRRALQGPLNAGTRTQRRAAFALMEAALDSHMKLLGVGRPRSAALENATAYNLEGLNITGDYPLVEYVAILSSFSQHLDRVQGRVPTGDTVRNMNLLLSGPPGSGKTEFAKYLARELNRPLMVRRASDLLDMYVGNSEKLIRRAFQQAEADQAILLLDEADSLLASRDRAATRNWEISQVNELLSSMEEFRGILVCTTNFKASLDPAALRRFNLKVGFDYLTPAGCATFFNRLLESLTGTPISAGEQKQLQQLNHLTPGDFKVVRQKYGFMPATAVTNQRLLAALTAEMECKNQLPARRMGFAVESRA